MIELKNKKNPETLYSSRFRERADDQNRTGDLRLTKATLYRLSHISVARGRFELSTPRV